ncbi:hypothetical protein NB554_10150 [Vibrio alginolyticus]|uniref:hypothetical protein n=1 Tax=Vibrio alginolyticus TaxID=663 RepID=UPI00215C983B|nr:hypothetical protein [Vibrio alginolyticus]MCR9884193.1 hypothetical protein [Vibrio alginolyticus]
MNNFYYFSARLLEESLIRTRLPNIHCFDIVGGKPKSNSKILDFTTRPPTPVPEELLGIVIFSILDSIIDIDNPQVEGCSFKARYDSLSSNDEQGIIFKEVYRVMKLIRNAMVHNRKNISKNNGEFSILYQNRGTDFHLKCSVGSIRELYNLSRVIIDHVDVEDRYFKLVLTELYNRFMSGVTVFTDEISSSLQAVRKNEDFFFYERYRYSIDIKDIENRDGSLFLNRCNDKYHHFIESENKEVIYENCDEYFILDNENRYLVPGHILSEHGALPLESLNEWKLGNRYFGGQG